MTGAVTTMAGTGRVGTGAVMPIRVGLGTSGGISAHAISAVCTGSPPAAEAWVVAVIIWVMSPMACMGRVWVAAVA
jgi:hypothetical protein